MNDMGKHITEEQELLDQAMDALRRVAGLDIAVIQYKPLVERVRADAHLKVAFNHKNYDFVVKVKNVDRFATVTQVKHLLEEFDQAPLLITPVLTGAAADHCRALGLNFIDLAGNAYINEPGFFIFIKGQKLAAQNNQLTGNRALTPAHLRMVFALLCDPALLNAPYREIAKTAGIALGTIGRGFDDLVARGLILGDGKKSQRVFIQLEKLIQEWVTIYPIKLRPKLNPMRFKARYQGWWKNLDVRNYDAQWGGEVAADKLTHYLKPNFFTLYLHGKGMKKNMSRLIIENRLVPDPVGNVEILAVFWNDGDVNRLPEIVPTLLIYADLVASNDPRNLETAKMIYDEMIRRADN